MSLHIQLPWCPLCKATAPLSRSTLTGAELSQAKNILHLCLQGPLSCLTLYSPGLACQAFSIRKRVLQARILGVCNTGCHILLVAMFHNLAAKPFEYLVLPESLLRKQLHHLHTPGPHRGKIKPSRGGLGANPSG